MTQTPVQRHVRGDHGSYSVVGKSISQGGVGAIYRTSDPRWVYKQYHSPDKAPPADEMERLVGVGRDVLFRQGLEIGARPESSINWPVDIVRTPDRKIIGCVLPAIPQRFFHPTLKNVNTLDFLIMLRADPPPARFRMIVLMRLAEILAFVHAKGLVHGDVNPKNVAWTVDPEPAAYLIDCDGMVPQNPPPKVGVGAPNWTDPRVKDRIVPAHDHYSDWYCLALAFYRGLLLIPGSLGKDDQTGIWSAPSQIPADLDPRVATLMRRALNKPLDPAGRPEPNEWARTMYDVYVVGGRYDDAALAKLDRTRNAPKPKPATPPPDFKPLPHAGQPQPTVPHQPPPRPAPHVYRQPARPTPPVHQQQPSHLYQQPPQQYTHPAPPHHFQQTTHGNPPGGLARWAMAGGVAWYLPIALLSFCLGPVAAVLCGLVLAQTIKTDPDYPGRTAAIVSSCVGLGVGGLFALSWLASLAS
jgi:hypothetical protein